MLAGLVTCESHEGRIYSRILSLADRRAFHCIFTSSSLCTCLLSNFLFLWGHVRIYWIRALPNDHIFSLITSVKTFSPKYSHILRYWRLGLQYVFLFCSVFVVVYFVFLGFFGGAAMTQLNSTVNSFSSLNESTGPIWLTEFWYSLPSVDPLFRNGLAF